MIPSWFKQCSQQTFAQHFRHFVLMLQKYLALQCIYISTKYSFNIVLKYFMNKSPDILTSLLTLCVDVLLTFNQHYPMISIKCTTLNVQTSQ